MDRKIIWEKWNDPLSSAFHDYKEMQASIVEDMVENDADEDDILDRPHPIKGPVLMSPMGPIPIHQDNIPSKIFNFWIGHTNFRINQEVLDSIEGVEGVEVLNVWTPYRFRLGIAKAFMDREVMHGIEKATLMKKGYLSKKEVVDRLATHLKSKYRNFSIGKDENGGLVSSKDKIEDSIYDWKQNEKS